MNFKDLEQLAYYKFCLYKKDAWIYKQKQSEDGRAFLKELSDLTKKDADYEKISNISVKEG